MMFLARNDEDSGSGSEVFSDEFTALNGGRGAKKPAESGSHACFLALAHGVYNFRVCIVLSWLVAMVVSTPFAWFLIGNVVPVAKDPPHGSDSMAAQEMFESKFDYLIGMKKEMVAFQCRSPCETIATALTAGYVQEVEALVRRFGYDNPGTIIHVDSYYTYGEKLPYDNPMLSYDKQSLLMEWMWRVPGTLKFKAVEMAGEMEDLLAEINGLQDEIFAEATGPTFLNRAMKMVLIREVPVHEIITLWLPFSIIAFRLRSVRLLILALCSMPIAILITFGIMYFVSLHTLVLTYSVMMMLMLNMALSFDYSLFTLTRYMEEITGGTSEKDAVLTVITQSGHVIAVSGLVLSIAYGSMLVLPGAFKSFCVAACSMIIISLGVQITWIPAMLAIFPFLGRGGCPEKREKHDPFKDEPMLDREDGSDDQDNELGGSSTAHALEKAAPHKKGIYFWMGGHLTAFPWNIIVPLVIYVGMSPLTLRMGKALAYEDGKLRLKMGHAFELQLPRHRREWELALQIQHDFSKDVGCMMPMLIIASNALPPGPGDARATTLAPTTATLLGGDSAAGPNGSNETGAAASNGTNGTNTTAVETTTVLPPFTPPASIDVRGQPFFEANCRMVNSLIFATKEETYAVKADDFQSATFHGEEEDGEVKCTDYELIHMLRTSFFAKQFYYTSTTSDLLQTLWSRLVSQNKDAMLTIMNPSMDPFSHEAFELVRQMRQVLENETQSAQSLDSEVPGLAFSTYSATAVMMDMIDAADERLPFAFLGCVTVCFGLIAMSFGALLIPFKLFFTVILPITWAYGFGFLVYEDGILEWTGIEGLMPTADAGIDWTVPIFTLTIMLGLALDYDVFLFERVFEFRQDGFGDREAIQLGLSATGPTISAAGLIFAFTFVAMILGTMPVTNQIGCIFIFSIVVDTFIVRTVLVPAMLSLNPCLNYWPTKMPEPKFRWLEPDATVSDADEDDLK